jgi:hypothetical protein
LFGRSPGYNPAEDNIVRVAMRQLRARLKEYFDSEGAQEPWILDVPKGHYVPELRRRPEPVTSEESAPEEKKRSARWKFALAMSIGVSLLAACYLARGVVRGGDLARAPETTALIASMFPGAKRINVILPDTTLVLFHSLTGRLISLAEYARHEPGLRSTDLPVAVPLLWADLENMPLTSVADATFTASLVGSGTMRDRIRVLHARQVDVPDFRMDDSILLGGPRVNPWVELFEKDLNFRFEYRNRGQHGCFVNLQPRAGERPRYGNCSNTEDVVYVRLAWVPNLDGSGRVLLLGGTGMEASQAGCDFLLRSSTLADVLAATKARSINELSSFELLLQTTRKAGSPTTPKVISARAVFRNR